MVRVQKCFFWALNLGFWPKNLIFAIRPQFCQRPVCSPQRGRSFPTLGTIIRLSVPEVQQFSLKKSGWRLKKSSPSSLWGHRLPVTALALSARGLDNKYLDWKNSQKGSFQLFWGYQKWHFRCPNHNSKITSQYKYPPKKNQFSNNFLFQFQITVAIEGIVNKNKMFLPLKKSAKFALQISLKMPKSQVFKSNPHTLDELFLGQTFFPWYSYV